MAGLNYIGRQAENARDVETKLDAEDVYDSGVSREYVSVKLNELASAKATKVYVDTKDNQFAAASYPVAQDALLVPNAAKASPNGVASLGPDLKIPQVQIPILGAGMLRGPYGPTNQVAGITGVSPIRIADLWNGPTAVVGLIWVWANVICKSNGGRPVIEVRAGPTSATTYAAQTLIARGSGRSFYHGYQTVAVKPVGAPGEGQDGVQDSWSSVPPTLVQMWMYDAAGGQTETQSGYISTCTLYLARTTL